MHLYYVYALKFLEGSIRNFMVTSGGGGTGGVQGGREKRTFHQVFLCVLKKNFFTTYVLFPRFLICEGIKLMNRTVPL